MSKHKKENKITDLAVQPPCESVLKLHAMRANTIAYVWRNAANPLIEFPPIEENGWIADGSIQWVNDRFPDDVEDLLVQSDDDDCGDDSERESDDSNADF